MCLGNEKLSSRSTKSGFRTESNIQESPGFSHQNGRHLWMFTRKAWYSCGMNYGFVPLPECYCLKMCNTSLQRAQPLRTWRPRKPIRLWGANLDPFYRWKSMTASCKLLHIWLVVEPPLWKIISQLGLYYSQSIEKYKMLRTTNHSLYFLRLSQCPNKRWNLALNICNLHSFIPYLQTLHKPESPQRTLNKQSINPTNPLNQL